MIAITVIRNFFATSGNKRGQTGQCREGAAGIDSDHDSWNIIIEVDFAAGRWKKLHQEPFALYPRLNPVKA